MTCLIQHLLQQLPPQLEGFGAEITFAFAKQIKEHDGSRNRFGQEPNARRGRMKTQLEPVEIEPVVLHNDQFAVQHATRRQGREQRLHKFWKISIERLLIAALDEDVCAVAEY